MEKLRLSNSEIENLTEVIKENLKKFNRITDIKIDTKELNKISYTGVKPIIYIEPEVYIKMMELVQESDVEIAWHMLCERNLNEQVYRIYDILMFPQINGPTTTETDTKEFGEWFNNLIMDEKFPIENLRGHGHSHVNMSVFSSGVDDNYQKELINSVDDGDYYVFLICNKRHEICALIYDFENQVLFNNNDITTVIGDNLTLWAEEAVKKYCKVKKITYPTPKGNSKKYKAKDEINEETFRWESYYGGRW